jgi:hypothetical protein
MDDRFTPRPVARWYMAAAAAALLFTLIICVGFAKHAMTDPLTLPLDERTAFDAVPLWLTTVFGVGALAGLLGSLMLLLRRKAAQPLMLLSLAALLAWVGGILLVPQVRETSTANDLAVAVVIAAITWTIFWFARHSRQRGWLR